MAGRETHLRFINPETHELLSNLCKLAGGQEAVAMELGISYEAFKKQCQGESGCFLDTWFRMVVCLRSVPQEDGRLGVSQEGLDLMASWAAKLAGGRYEGPGK